MPLEKVKWQSRPGGIGKVKDEGQAGYTIK